MAYDEELSDRIRELIGGEAGLREQKMFGGLCFLIDDHITVAASGQGGMFVRLDPADGDRFVDQGKAEPMIMRGKPMSGYIRIGSDQVTTKRQLAAWVKRSVDYARTLPPKPPRKRR